MQAGRWSLVGSSWQRLPLLRVVILGGEAGARDRMAIRSTDAVDEIATASPSLTASNCTPP
jgi:hypothetical protein